MRPRAGGCSQGDGRNLVSRGDRAANIDERIANAFEKLGERRTEPRRIIARSLASLGRSGNTFSAEDLLRRLQRKSQHIGRATVYRSIEKLVRMKVLDRIEFADGTHLFRLCESDHHHHHLVCTKCHRVVELDICLESDRIDAIGRQQGFEVDDHSITLFGLCKDCRS